MFKNYLVTALRNIKKHKGYALINIVGLAVGLACALFILLWVRDELGYDGFHANAATLYRIEQDQSGDQGVFHVWVTPCPMGPAVKSEIPEIKETSRMGFPGSLLVRNGDKAFFESSVRAVDPAFLTIFSFPLVQGDVSSALARPDCIVISEKMAAKYFGHENPMGRTLTVNNAHSFQVMGVVSDAPPNSTVTYDMLVPFEFLKALGRGIERWGNNSIYTWVQLRDPAAAATVNQKITKLVFDKYLEGVTDPETIARIKSRPGPQFMLAPLTDIRLRSVVGFGERVGTMQSVLTFGAIAVFVLLIACINFMNLATARAANRAKEVGLRKVSGAYRRDIIGQFYGESALTTLLAVVAALGLVLLLLPAFNTLAAKQIPAAALLSRPFVFGLLAITAVTALVAGSYPAVVLSAFEPARVLKGGVAAGARGALFRKILVIVQFSLSIMLLIGTGVVVRQLSFMRAKDLGFDKEHLVYLPMRGDSAKSYTLLKSELLRDPRVTSVTGMSHPPTSIGSNSWSADWEGKNPDNRALISMAWVDHDYVETMRIQMVAGRPFSREHPADVKGAFLVNEGVAGAMGLKPSEAVGKWFDFQNVKGPIVGVMKDFHFLSVRVAIPPLAVMLDPEASSFAVVRLGSGDVRASLKQVEAVWRQVNPLYPFEYRFMDDDYDRMYQGYNRMGGILRYFTVMAVFIACLGLFGLASFMAEQRRKEIGVRKVLGASPRGIVVLMSSEFAKWVAMANLVAWPAGYLMMRAWLQSFAYRAPIPFWLFASAGAGALAVALLTVSGQAWRASQTNPATALKYE